MRLFGFLYQLTTLPPATPLLSRNRHSCIHLVMMTTSQVASAAVIPSHRLNGTLNLNWKMDLCPTVIISTRWGKSLFIYFWLNSRIFYCGCVCIYFWIIERLINVNYCIPLLLEFIFTLSFSNAWSRKEICPSQGYDVLPADVLVILLHGL